jgi:hypothetical protein
MFIVEAEVDGVLTATCESCADGAYQGPPDRPIYTCERCSDYGKIYIENEKSCQCNNLAGEFAQMRESAGICLL